MHQDDPMTPVQAELWERVEADYENFDSKNVSFYVMQEDNTIYLAFDPGPNSPYYSVDMKNLYRGLAESMLTLDERVGLLAKRVSEDS